MQLGASISGIESGPPFIVESSRFGSLFSALMLIYLLTNEDIQPFGESYYCGWVESSLFSSGIALLEK